MTSIGDPRVVRFAFISFFFASTLTAIPASAQSLPGGWAGSNIGNPALNGSATASAGTFSVTGAGVDIWGTSDQFMFVYRQISGDATIIARVATVQNVDQWTKAGVMIRESLTPGSRHAFAFATPGQGISFQRRTTTGGTTAHTYGGAGTAPVWVKLERRSKSLRMFRSPDGITWSKIGSATVSMSTIVYAGLAVTSHNPSTRATATFSNVSITSASATSNQPPTITLTAPASDETFAAPASIVLTATASDVDGAIARVDFYAGGTLVGTDSSSPYAFTWNAVAGGSYSITAVALDNGGATTTSAARTITLTAPQLPGGWTAMDIGAPAIGGSAQYFNGAFTVEGAGVDVWDRSDQFRYVYQPFTGDIEITSRVVSLENTNEWAKAGVMIRETLAANAVQTSLVVTPGHGTNFYRRLTTGDVTQPGPVGALGAPYWVRLERRGSIVTAFQSRDGTTWTSVGTASMSTPTMWVGLEVTSHDPAMAATAIFDNVTLRVPSGNQSPMISLTAPANGTIFTAPASIPVSATASDPDGTVVRVEFYAWSTLIGSDTTSPYGMTWGNVAAGSYSLTALAIDNGGGMTVSGARDIRVDGSTLPRTAIFTASTNHTASVDRYFLEIFPEGADPAVANPVATRDLGKPAVVGGECTVDVSSTTVALPPGSYIATVTAIGSGGSARSAASPTFVR